MTILVPRYLIKYYSERNYNYKFLHIAISYTSSLGAPHIKHHICLPISFMIILNSAGCKSSMFIEIERGTLEVIDG